MPIINKNKKKHMFQKVHARGYTGGTLMQSLARAAPALGNATSSFGSRLLSQVPNFFRNLFTRASLTTATKAIAPLAGAAALSFGIKKGIDYLGEPIQPIQAPQYDVKPLTVGPAPQGTFKGDILPTTANISVVDPKNSYIDLPDGKKKVTGGIIQEEKPKYVRPRRVAGQGIKKNNIENLLNQKSKTILNGLKYGKGLYNF